MGKLIQILEQIAVDAIIDIGRAAPSRRDMDYLSCCFSFMIETIEATGRPVQRWNGVLLCRKRLRRSWTSAGGSRRFHMRNPETLRRPWRDPRRN